MISIKERGLPETDRTYLILSPDYESKPFEAYLDDNGDWHDARVPKSGLAFIFYEVTHYEPVDLLENIDDLENEEDES
jgi:hypothetical protein